METIMYVLSYPLRYILNELSDMVNDFKKFIPDIINEIKNFYFDKINENIKNSFNIDINENILQQTKIVIRYLHKKFFFNANNKLFYACYIIYILSLISFMINFMTIFLSPNSVNILIFLNIIYLLSFIFCRGSEDFFELILIDDNLKFFFIFFVVIFLSMLTPKNIILLTPLNIILIIFNIYLICVLKFDKM